MLSIGITSMRKLLLPLLLMSPLAFSAPISTKPELAALKFNEWYIAQLKADKAPLSNMSSLIPYIAKDTLRAMKELYSGDSNDKELPDSDMFIKSQDIDDDWNHVEVLMSDVDVACANVYVSFGKKKDHVIADCMVQESGKWKVRNATLIKNLP